MPLKKQLYKNRYYYLLLIPAIAYFILFHIPRQFPLTRSRDSHLPDRGR